MSFMLLIVAVACLLASVLPLLMMVKNLRVFRPPVARDDLPTPRVSVLIPARDEEASIGDAVRAALASERVDVEVVVMDDHSSDRTAAIVRELAEQDERVKLTHAPALPEGWCGKQHACASLAPHASYPLMLFLDADVRLQPDAIRRAADMLRDDGLALVSGFPRQITLTLGEKLLIPLIHFVLLGFLPVWMARQSPKASFGAGCGQFILVDKRAYDEVGGHGHATVRRSMHEGIRMPRAFRSAGYRTDIFDATPIVTCRMYRNFSEVWHGLAKNATEGMGSPSQIVFWTVMLGLGQVLPTALLLGLLISGHPAGPATWACLTAALGCGYTARFALAANFRQSWVGALGHPVGIALLLGVQWYALIRQTLGRPAAWKGRQYTGAVAGS